MTPAEKARETRQRNRERWGAKVEAWRANKEKMRLALMRVVEDPNAGPAEIVEAVKMLEKMGTY